MTPFHHHDAVVTVVARNALVTGVNGVFRTFKDLKEVTVVIKEHAGNIVVGVVAPRLGKDCVDVIVLPRTGGGGRVNKPFQHGERSGLSCGTGR